jgi:hypothetical protein
LTWEILGNPGLKDVGLAIDGIPLGLGHRVGFLGRFFGRGGTRPYPSFAVIFGRGGTCPYPSFLGDKSDAVERVPTISRRGNS